MKLYVASLALLGRAARAEDFATSRVSAGQYGPVDGSALHHEGLDEPLIGEEGSYGASIVDGYHDDFSVEERKSNLSSSELGDEMLDSATLRRKLETGQIASDHWYRPLVCNSGLPTVPPQPSVEDLQGVGCTSLSSIASKNLIDACQCVYVDQDSVDGNGEIVMQGGMDIQGFLIFPHNMQVTVKTQFVFLQGKLQITNSEEIAPGKGVTFFFKGANDLTFKPHTDHFNTADIPAGSKPFLVAGGSLNIDGWQETCPTWLNIEDVVFDNYEDGLEEGTYDSPVDPPEGCSRELVQNDFESGQGEWNGRLGGIDTIEIDALGDTVSGNSFLRVDNRTRHWQGPAISLNKDTRKCITSGTKYFFSARFRLSRADGQPTNCASKGENCLVFNLYHKHNPHNWDRYYTRAWVQATQGEGLSTGMDMVTDGEWFTWMGEFGFSADEADPEKTVAERIQIYGPEEGVTIDMDDVTVGLAPLGGFPNPDTVSSGEICQELFPADSGANGYLDPPMYPYPLKTNNGDYHSALVVMKENDSTAPDGVNYFYRNSNKFYHWHSMTWDLTRGCLRLGAYYRITFRARVNSPLSSPHAKPQVIFYPTTGSAVVASGPAREAGGDKGWVDYSLELYIAQNMANAAADGRVEFRFDAGHHRRYADVDYDDISIKLIHGPIKGIVVKDAGVAGCWGGGNELVVTSHTFSQNHEQVVPLADDEPVTLIGDGKAVLNLKTALPKYPTTAVLDAEQASEVALLGRNIRFEADTDVPHKGGYLNVLRTFNVTQKIRGVDFNRFGHLDQGNRYPIHFDRLDKVPDGKIEYNLIRQSNMRCVILNGLEGVTVEGNVAYNNKGICFGTFAGREQVTITNNLAIRTRQNLDSWRTASFYIRDPRVIFKGNVAAGSDRKGIYFQPEWRTSVNYHNMPAHKRNWNPRDTALGAFENNVAHSCAEWGLVLSTYHPLGNEPSTQVFSTYRGFRNVNNAHMDVRGVALDDWYLADGRHRNLDLQWSTDIHINDMKIVAYSPTFRKQVKEQTHIWHTCKDVNEKQRLDRLIGFEVFHKRGWKDWSGYDKTTAGVVMKGVTFEGFEDTGCAASNPFYAERHREQPHFDAFLAIESMTSSTEEAVLNLCTFESLEVQDVVITDADSSMGPILTGKAEGSFSGPSSIVSDYDYMKGFAGGECTSNAGKCLAYCENTCLQFVSWEVTPYGTEDVLLVVEDVNSGKSISVPGNFEVSKNNDGTPNVYYNTFLYDMRKFSAALPAGEYTAQFVKDGQPYWPTHAYDRFERKPPCMGDGSVTVTLERPDPTLEECTELVKNGDVELGNYTHWVHVNGGVEAMEGEGVDGSYAMLNKRSHRHHGIGFYVDTRCTKLMEGHEYRITAQVRLQDANGAAVSCDPDSLDENNMCPTMWLQTKKYRQDANTIDVWNMANVAMSVRPWNMVGYTLIEGTFVVKDTIAQADSVFLWVTRGGSKHIVVDNTSIKLHYRGDVSPPAADAMPLAMMAPIPKAECPKEFLMNKGFELGTTEYWRNRGYGGKGKLEIVPGGADGTGHALKMTNVGHYYNGPLQWIDSTCLEEGAEYEVSARFKLTNMATGEPHYCDTSVWRNGNINQCPVMTLSIWTDTSSGAYHLAKTVDAGNADNWATISKIVVGNANMHNSWQAFLYLEFIPVGIDITVDDVSFARYEKDCSNVVRDGDFEDGASGSWGSVLSAPPIAIDGGYGSAGKAICLGKCGINSSGRTSRDSHIYQNLDKDCILPNVEYVITAKVKLLDQDTQQPVGCNPNMINGAEACPFADIATDANGEWRGRVVGAVVGADDDSWYMLSGVFMFYDWDLPGNTLQLRFYRAPALVDMVVDDISISLRDSSFLA